MTFLAVESSVEAGKPVELYSFVQGGESYFYTSSDTLQVVDTIDYEPEVISRGRVSEGPDERRNYLEITVPGTNLFAVNYISSVPGPKAVLTISQFHATDTPTPEVVTVFQGNVQSVSFVENGQVAKIAVLPVIGAAGHSCPRFTYQGLCNNFLYDIFCKVDPEDPAFKHVGEVLSATGSVIVVEGADSFPDGWFVAGFAQSTSGLDARLIIDHVGTSLTLLLPFTENVAGLNITLRAGCDHTPETCDTKFFTAEDPDSNVLNFGGFPFVPTKNIFQTGLK